MPGEANNSTAVVKDKLLLLANGIIMLMILSLASQLFLILESYVPNSQLWLNLILSVLAAVMGILEAKKAVDVSSSTRVVVVFNLLLLSGGVWLTGFNYSRGLLLGVGIIVIVLYRLTASLARRVEYLRLGFSNLSKSRQERQGLNFKRHGKILHDLKLIFIVIDSLVIISWLVAQEVGLILILSGAATLILQFLLWQVMVLIIKGLNWFLKKFKVDFNVFFRSISWSVLIIIIISCLSFLLPVQYGHDVGNLIATQLDNWYEETNTGITLDLKKLRQDVAEKTRPPSKVEADWNNEVNWSTILFFIALIIGGVSLVIWLGLLLLFIIKGEVKKVKELPSLIVDFIKSVAALFKGWFDLFKSGAQKVKEFVPESKKKTQKLDKKSTSAGQKNSSKQYRQEVLRLLAELLNLLADNGLSKEKFETMEEYFAHLKFELEIAEQRLVWLQQVIEKAIYSREEIDYQTKEKIKKLMTDLEHKYL